MQRVFKKETSVFKEWKEDNFQTYQQLLADDFKFWKIYRFVKDDEDVRIDHFPEIFL